MLYKELKCIYIYIYICVWILCRKFKVKPIFQKEIWLEHYNLSLWVKLHKEFYLNILVLRKSNLRTVSV